MILNWHYMKPRGESHRGAFADPTEPGTERQASHAILARSSRKKKSMCFLKCNKDLVWYRKTIPISPLGQISSIATNTGLFQARKCVDIAPRKGGIESERTLILNRIHQYKKKKVRPLKIITCHKRGQSWVSWRWGCWVPHSRLGDIIMNTATPCRWCFFPQRLCVRRVLTQSGLSPHAVTVKFKGRIPPTVKGPPENLPWSPYVPSQPLNYGGADFSGKPACSLPSCSGISEVLLTAYKAWKCTEGLSFCGYGPGRNLGLMEGTFGQN